MKKFLLNKISKTKQYLVSILLVCIVSALCYVLSEYVGYRVVAFILLVTVSFVAMFFDILPVLLAALLSALIWNFFFIPPKFTFSIGSTEDVLMFLMYFVIATVNAALTFKIRQMEKQGMEQEEKERTLKLYSTLLNSLSHEFRTPISAIIGAADNLQHNAGKLSEQNKNELVSEISSAAFRLNQQVENLLNMSRLESGFIQLKKDWVDISELIYDVVKRVEQNIVTQKININVSPDAPLFKLDKVMMEQAVYNLLNNATLYTPDKSTINVSAASIDHKLEIIVEDNGPGFPESEIKKVFDKFYRLKNSKAGGTGLGLSIARGFVEAHRGTIKLENTPTGGAQFTISAPVETTHVSNFKNE
jgi:two-component system sensor histidine kinase KdpD